MRTALSLLLWLLITLSGASGQDCQSEQIDNCSSTLQVEIVRQFQNVEPGPTCAAGTTFLCGGADNFRQMVYKVYLRYTPSSTKPQTPFYLRYGSVRLVTELHSSVKGIYSHIDVAATKDCYTTGAGANWKPDKVAFRIYENTQTVEIDFMNEDPANAPCGTVGDNAILFTWGAPQGINVEACPSQHGCAYAELFTVVVNAYAGETIRLRNAASQFSPPDIEGGQQSCIPIPSVTTLNNSHNGMAPTTMLDPAPPTGTPNSNLSLELPAPVSINGKQHFEMRIRNNGSQPLTISYLEYVVKISPSKDVPLSFSGNHQPRPPKKSGTDYFLHYMVPLPNGVTINAGQTYSVGFIEVSPPVPVNQGWSVTASWVSEAQSRASSGGGCTSLPVPQSPVSSSHASPGISNCTAPSPDFVVRLNNGIFDPCSAQPVVVQAGLTVPAGQMNVIRFFFELEFDLSGTLGITGVNFDDWVSGWSCPSDPGSCVPPGSDDPCYNIVGDNVVQFCFATLSSNPINLGQEAFVNIVFNNQPGCIKKVIVRELGLACSGGGGTCIPPINNQLDNGVPNCPPVVRGTIATELGDGVQGVTVAVTSSSSGSQCQQPPGCAQSSYNPSAQTTQTTDNGDYGVCPCADCACFDIVPSSDGDHLNGVTTFDLVLITRHILGLEPLDSPYKMIAADANKSNSVTTFDIVEIRKLILGIYSEFPDNTAWRFVDAAHDFPNPADPFQTPPMPPIPESRTSFDARGGDKASFVAVKVGDVNNSAMGVDRGAGERPAVPLAWGGPAAKPGQTVTVAVSHAGAAPLRAFQLGLRFDPALLRLLGPSQGDLPGYQADHFGLARVSGGEIRTLWHALDPDEPELMAEPGATLFHLTFEALGPLPEGGLPLWLDEGVLPCAAWLADDTECAVTQAPLPVAGRAAAAAPVAGSLRVSARPNPTSGEATLALSGASGGKARVSLLDAFGNRLLLRDVAVGADGQEVALPELARLPAGVYRWQVQANGETAQGHLVKH